MTFRVVVSDNVAVAVNCCVAATSMLGFAGVKAIETIAAGVTLTVVVCTALPQVTVMVLLPVATVLTVLEAPVLGLSVATPVLEDDQVQLLNIEELAAEPSDIVPLRVSDCVRPNAREKSMVENEKDCSVAAVTVSRVVPSTPPLDAVMVLLPAATA